MGEQSAEGMSTPSGAVFLSYASQDVGAARRICDALRAAGIEVWLDQSELRGGDSWDRKIRDQIRHCALFIPIISAHSEGRLEGYFRREWKFAVERKRDIADELAFLLPLVIDETSERGASVPEGFHEVQWTRLPGGASSQDFIQHVSRLLAGHSSRRKPAAQVLPSFGPPPARSGSETKYGSPLGIWPLLIGLATAVLVGYIGIDRYVLHKRTQPAATSTTAANADKSIAVLPFADMSEKHDREFFADGLAEELIDRLARETKLKVIARTSSFQFRNKNEDSAAISSKLGVAYLVEGSVRAVGERLRISVQLIRGSDGTNEWSENFDRSAGDLFRVQDEIAASVAKELSVSFAAPQRSSASGEVPGYVLMLQALSITHTYGNAAELERGIELLEQATKVNPKLAQAWAELSLLRTALMIDYPSAAPRESTYAKARDEASHALRLDPDLPDGHVALARIAMQFDHDWRQASQEISAALVQGGGSADVQRNAFHLSTSLGHWDEGVSQMRRAVELDPLNYNNFLWLGYALLYAGQYVESVAAFRTAISLKPDADYLRATFAVALRLDGKWDEALSEAEREPLEVSRLQTVAELLYLRDRAHEADPLLANLRSKYGRDYPFYVAEVYAIRHDLDDAFDWWERAVREHDANAQYLLAETRDPALSQATSDHRFKELLRKLNLPE